MNIDIVRVRGLFDYFDHDLEFRTDERVMIVIGPNGFGKTTTLRLINTLFNQPIARLAEMPFRQIEISFDRDKSLVVEKDTQAAQPNGRLPLTLIFQEGRESPRSFRPPSQRQMSLDLFTKLQDDVPRWWQNVRNTVSVRLIDTERLTTIPDYTQNPERTIRICSEELADLVSKTNAEYATLSQSLDRTFPVRLVSSIGRSEQPAKLSADLDEIKRKQSLLAKAGLLSKDHGSIELPDIDNVDSPRRDVLAMYAHDTKIKLNVFDELYPKIEALLKIANSRLRYKHVIASRDGLSAVSWNGADLDLDMLSSGEQHELVILYELLFRTSENSLILIDEPELSQHVAWQEKFVNDLEEMAEISHFRAILATHSPEIIADRWDLAVELNGPNGR